MSQKTFCDICDQELVIPDEKVDFVTGQPTSGKGDICWQCRLQEVVALYNEKTKDTPSRRAAYISWFEMMSGINPSFVFHSTDAFIDPERKTDTSNWSDRFPGGPQRAEP